MECQLCLNLFASNSLELSPVLLHCGHSICKGCLTQKLIAEKDVPLDSYETKMEDTAKQMDPQIMIRDSFMNHLFVPRKCLVHDQPYFYIDQSSTSSNRLLCVDCIDGECSQLLRLGKSSASFTESKCDYLRDQSPNLSHLLSELREEEQSLGSRMVRLSESKSQAQSDLKQKFEDLRKALSSREEALERELEEVYKCCLFELEDGRERSRIWQGQLSVLLGCVAELERVLPSFPQKEKRATVEKDVEEVDSALGRNYDINPKQSNEINSPDVTKHVKDKDLENEIPLHPSLLCKRPLSSDFTIDPELVVKICLLEDAVRNTITSLSSSNSPLSYSSTSSDEISMSFDESGQDMHEPSELESVLSMFGAVTSSSSRFVPVDWSVNNVQHIFTSKFFDPFHFCPVSNSKLLFADECDDVNRLVSIEKAPDPQHRIHSYRGPFKLKVSTILSEYTDEMCIYGMCLHRGLLYITSDVIQIWREKDASLVGGFGSEDTADGQFISPRGCLIYKDELYVSDFGNRIQVLSLPNGKFIRKFGSFLSSGKGKLNQPNSLQIYQDQLFVADSKNNRVVVFNPNNGAFLFEIGPNLPPHLSLVDPQCILIHKGLLFVAFPKQIMVLTCKGEYLYSFGSNFVLTDVQGMAMLNDQLFVSDGQILVFEQK